MSILSASLGLAFPAVHSFPIWFAGRWIWYWNEDFMLSPGLAESRIWFPVWCQLGDHALPKFIAVKEARLQPLPDQLAAATGRADS